MNITSFDRAILKGKIGEACIKKRLEANGYIVYRPETDGAHWVDMLGVKGKEIAIAVDVKAKARMNNWPATGINQKSFEEYQKFSEKYNMPFYVVFVDEGERRIYGNTIEKLEQLRNVDGIDYPFILPITGGGNVRLWPLVAMEDIAPLDDDIVQQLKSLNQRGYEYAPQARQS